VRQIFATKFGIVAKIADNLTMPNQVLSENRSESFRQSLIDHYGVDPSRIEWRGLGESQPLQSNATEEGRYANRRIVITPL
jgi:OOP family OmpA-OmpF porin